MAKPATDVVTLSGNYSAGVVFTSTTMINVEGLQLIGAFDYKLTFDDATATPIMSISANGVTGGHHLYLDASAEADAMLFITGTKSGDVIFGGGGNDKITPNGGDDTIHGGGGNDQITAQNSLTAADRIDGGSGYDTLVLSGDYSAGLTFDADTVTNVDFIQLGIVSTKLILHDNTNNSSLLISGFNLGAGETLYVDGSAESSAGLAISGGDGGNTLIGGAGNDSFNGGANADLLVAGGGENTLFGLGGADTFQIDGNAAGITAIYDLNLGEGASLHITDILDGAGDDLQDLLDAGFEAFSTGTNCIITNGSLTIYLMGYSTPLANLSELAGQMGSQLVVTH